MRNRILLAALLIASLVLAACAASTPLTGRSTVPEKLEKVVGRVAVESAASGAKGSEAYAGNVSDTAVPAATEQMIIRRANLELIVKDTEKALAEITRIVNGLSGYVSDSNAYRVEEQLQATLTVRLPAKDMDAALTQFRALAVRVQRETTGTENVTMEYTDLAARLKNLEMAEKELQELLGEVRQKTGKAEDILAVYNRLTEIRGEIEQIKGRMQYLGNLVDLSTIGMTLIPDVLAKPVVKPGWRPLETLRGAASALISALQGLVNVIIWLAVFALPILLVLAIPLVLLILVIRALQRRRKAKKA